MTALVLLMQIVKYCGEKWWWDMRSWPVPQDGMPAEVCQPSMVHCYSVSRDSDRLSLLHLHERNAEHNADRLLLQCPPHWRLVRELRSWQHSRQHFRVLLLLQEISSKGKYLPIDWLLSLMLLVTHLTTAWQVLSFGLILTSLGCLLHGLPHFFIDYQDKLQSTEGGTTAAELLNR